MSARRRNTEHSDSDNNPLESSDNEDDEDNSEISGGNENLDLPVSSMDIADCADKKDTKILTDDDPKKYKQERQSLKKDPAFVPRGQFFLHDDRDATLQSQDRKRISSVKTINSGHNSRSNKSKDESCWRHDKFDDRNETLTKSGKLSQGKDSVNVEYRDNVRLDASNGIYSGTTWPSKRNNSNTSDAGPLVSTGMSGHSDSVKINSEIVSSPSKTRKQYSKQAESSQNVHYDSNRKLQSSHVHYNSKGDNINSHSTTGSGKYAGNSNNFHDSKDPIVGRRSPRTNSEREARIIPRVGGFTADPGPLRTKYSHANDNRNNDDHYQKFNSRDNVAAGGRYVADSRKPSYRHSVDDSAEQHSNSGRYHSQTDVNSDRSPRSFPAGRATREKYDSSFLQRVPEDRQQSQHRDTVVVSSTGTHNNRLSTPVKGPPGLDNVVLNPTAQAFQPTPTTTPSINKNSSDSEFPSSFDVGDGSNASGEIDDYNQQQQQYDQYASVQYASAEYGQSVDHYLQQQMAHQMQQQMAAAAMSGSMGSSDLMLDTYGNALPVMYGGYHQAAVASASAYDPSLLYHMNTDPASWYAAATDLSSMQQQQAQSGTVYYPITSPVTQSQKASK